MINWLNCIFIAIMGLFSIILKAQSSDLLYVYQQNSKIGIKNVNILIPKLDTVLITDTAGFVNLAGLKNYDSIIVKKYGYNKILINNNQRKVFLTKDTTIFSHNLKLLDLKFTNGYSFIKLSIDGEIFWFKQNIGPLFLGNGKELETGKEYAEIFRNHKIIKTVSVSADYCLWKIRGENYANGIFAIYYQQDIKHNKSKYYPINSWSTKHAMKKDIKILKLQSGCLD